MAIGDGKSMTITNMTAESYLKALLLSPEHSHVSISIANGNSKELAIGFSSMVHSEMLTVMKTTRRMQRPMLTNQLQRISAS